MSVPGGKSPVSYLIEVCQKRAVIPQFSLVANEGPVNEPLFVFRLTVNDITVTGRGTSKKKAKQEASLQMLQELGVVSEDYKDPNASSTVFDATGNEISNPVGRLQEFTQKRLMPPPTFDFNCAESNENSSTPTREFVCTVTLGRFTEKGEARSKKTAKRLAAINMLKKLEILQLEGGDPEGGVNTAEGATEKRLVEEEEESIPVNLLYLCQYADSIRPLEPNCGVELMEFSTRMRKRATGNRPMLQAVQNHDSFCNQMTMTDDLNDEALVPVKPDWLTLPDAVPLLERVMKENKWSASYSEWPAPGDNPNHYVLCEMTTKPAACFLGSGVDLERAKRDAALKALEYLRLMLLQN